MAFAQRYENSHARQSGGGMLQDLFFLAVRPSCQSRLAWHVQGGTAKAQVFEDRLELNIKPGLIRQKSGAFS